VPDDCVAFIYHQSLPNRWPLFNCIVPAYLIYFVETRHRPPGELAPALVPLAKFPNSVVAYNQNHLLMLRDYSANVRRMLDTLRRLDVPGAAQPPKAPPMRIERPAGKVE
jgi:type II secretory pathway component GspD/PulD (secretin)